MTRQEILKNAKPILFNTEMVRAILDGRKTVTRRLIKPQPKERLSYIFAGYGCGKWSYPSKCSVEIWGADYQLPDDLTEKEKGMLWTPPCHTDDILYVRETWQYIDFAGENNGYVYRASENGKLWEIESENWTWKPSIHMPKEAARIFLKVEDVRVERLRDITEEQASSEGVPDDLDYPISKVYCPRCHGEGLIGAVCANLGYMEVDCPDCDTAIKRFKNIWNSTIKKSDLDRYGWDANPWIWVIEFERIEVE